MEISRHSRGDQLELRLNGRLDAAWASHVGSAIEAAVRAGSHHIAINCASVEYISSLGLAVLLEHYKRLKAVQGSLAVIEPSPGVLAVIQTARLAGLLLTPVAPPTSAASPRVISVEKGGARYEVYVQVPGASLECTLLGQPAKFTAGGFEELDCHALPLPEGTLAVGLGAFGNGFADCRDRFGEFLAGAGVAIALPPGEHGVPDFVVTQGDHVPRVEALYALAATGALSSMVRFDAKSDGAGVLGLSELLESSLELIGANDVGFVILAEAAGVVGATVRRSPATAEGATPLAFPDVRDWLSFTTERANDRHLVLIVGFATRAASQEAAAFLRRLTPGSPIEAHCHAALFPYRPIPKGELPLASTVSGVVSTSPPIDVLHLMTDTREFEGVGQTDLLRGACWIGPARGIGRA